MTTSTLAEIEARREARKVARAAEREAQRALDLEALDAAEIEHGDESVVALDLPWEPGLPTIAIGRRPLPIEVKRYQARVRGANADSVEAAREVGLSCLVYPPAGDQRARMLEALPVLLVQLGPACLDLASGRERARGKE